LLNFLAEVVAITASGALSPGPLTIATIRRGIEHGWKAGFQVSIGHTIGEFSLVIVLALGFSKFLIFDFARIIVGIVGGIALAIYGIMQLRSISKDDLVHPHENYDGSSVWIGLTFSIFNPYFIVWWATVGLKLIADALTYASFMGIIVMYVAHVWMDYAWLMLLSHLAFEGKRLFSEKAYRLLLVGLSLMMLIFATYFIVDSTLILLAQT